jgi:hypothetical protein
MDAKVPEFLDPDSLRPWLIAASIYIATFESFKDAVVSHVREFHSIGWDENGPIMSDDYRSKVLSRNRSEVYASLAWFQDQGALDAMDLQAFARIKELRNELAHKLLSVILGEGLPSHFDRRFEELTQLLNKVEVWWVLNVEVPTNPDFDDVTIEPAQVIPGRLATLHMLLQIALGDTAESRAYVEEYRRRMDANPPKKADTS